MKRIKFIAVMLAVSVCLFGCQKAPEVSSNGEVAHAKDSVEKAADNIVQQTQGEVSSVGGEYLDCVIGTSENGIKIQADIPNMPNEAYEIAVQPISRISKEIMTELLDSNTGNVQDLSESTKKELDELTESQKSLTGEEAVRQMGFGYGSVVHLSDGEKEVFFNGGGSITYTDIQLNNRCALNGSDETRISDKDMDTAFSGFSANDAIQMVLDKLNVLGISDVHIYEIVRYERDGLSFYGINFTPAFYSTGIAHEFGEVVVGEIHPEGNAIVASNGIAYLSLSDAYVEVVKESKASGLLSFTQIQQILEKYLSSGKLASSAEIALTEVEFVYYPVYDEDTLKLIPAWNICLPIWDYLSLEGVDGSFAYNIYINASSGELLLVE